MLEQIAAKLGKDLFSLCTAVGCALADAIDAGKPSKELSVLLDKYLQAKAAQDKMDRDAAATYKGVLPVEKVAKLYVAEEKFRRQYINKLHKRPEERK